MTKSKLFQLLRFAALTALIPAPGSAAEIGPVTQAIQTMNKQFVDYMMKRDARGLGSLYFEDALLQFPGAATVEGRSRIQDYWATALEGGITSVDIRSDKIVSLAPDVALQVGTYTIVVPGGADEGPTTLNGKYAAVYQRRDGIWKVVLDAGSE